MITLNVNGEDHELDVNPSMPLLWVIRDRLNLTGTKYGCGHAMRASVGLGSTCATHGPASASYASPIRDAKAKPGGPFAARSKEPVNFLLSPLSASLADAEYIIDAGAARRV